MNHREYASFIGKTLLDRSGAKVGTIEDVYADRETQKAEWALVRTDLFGLRKSLVPFAVLAFDADAAWAPYTGEQIIAAPGVEEEEEISAEAEERLFQHYGLAHPADAAETGDSREGAEVVRSQEQLRVGKVRRPSELVRMGRRVEAQPVQGIVELERDLVRIVREPVSRGESRSGARIGEEAVQEIQLQREEPLIEKEVVATERVRLEKEVKTERRRVADEVRQERVEVQREDAAPES